MAGCRAEEPGVTGREMGRLMESGWVGVGVGAGDLGRRVGLVGKGDTRDISESSVRRRRYSLDDRGGWSVATEIVGTKHAYPL